MDAKDILPTPSALWFCRRACRPDYCGTGSSSDQTTGQSRSHCEAGDSPPRLLRKKTRILRVLAPFRNTASSSRFTFEIERYDNHMTTTGLTSYDLSIVLRLDGHPLRR